MLRLCEISVDVLDRFFSVEAIGNFRCVDLDGEATTASAPVVFFPGKAAKASTEEIQ